MKKILQTILLLLCITFSFSCKKYLEAKSDVKLAIISSAEDAEALLDDFATISSAFPAALETSSDDYYVDDINLNLVANQSFDSDTYLWRKNEVFEDYWTSSFKVVTNTNIVIDELLKLDRTSITEKKINSVIGNAYFLRGYMFYILSQLYGQPYNPVSASKDLGIPLRLTSNVEDKSIRQSVDQCYNQILSDLKTASNLLPIKNLVKTRGSKSAAFGAISRVYLTMGKYDSSAKYANLCLATDDNLINYNSIDPSSFEPFPIFNQEVLFHMISVPSGILQSWVANIDTILIEKYNENDLRKTIFFQRNGEKKFSFKGGYNGYAYGLTYIFGGIATDEVYLIRAESYARNGQLQPALDDLNKLLINRIKESDYTPFNSTNKNEIIDRILEERRKELVFRGIRWSDLRRYILESDKIIIPKRKVKGEIIELLPNSPRYTLAIPAVAIKLSGMPQNP